MLLREVMEGGPLPQSRSRRSATPAGSPTCPGSRPAAAPSPRPCSELPAAALPSPAAAWELVQLPWPPALPGSESVATGDLPEREIGPAWRLQGSPGEGGSSGGVGRRLPLPDRGHLPVALGARTGCRSASSWRGWQAGDFEPICRALVRKPAGVAAVRLPARPSASQDRAELT